MKRISALIKVTPKSSFVSSATWGHSKKIAIYELVCGTLPNTDNILILDFPTSRAMKNQFLLFVSHTACGILLSQLKWTETQRNLLLLLEAS